jgi:hypothetical protein
MPRDTSAGPAGAARVRLLQQWARLDGSHPDFDPIEHEHVVRLYWHRTTLEASLPVGGDWDVELDVSFDVKDVRARYETPDGGSYDSPTGDLHHRTERLEGIADLRLLANWRPRGVFFDGDFAHVGVGVSLPTGRIEVNPYRLGDAGLKHQHIQFGTGTVDPILRLDYVLDGPLGFAASVGVAAPLAENRHDYRGAALTDLAVGPRARIGEMLSVTLAYAAQYQMRATWDGENDPNSGYFLQAVSLSGSIRVSETFTLSSTALRTISIDSRGSGDTFEMDCMVGLALEGRW